VVPEWTQRDFDIYFLKMARRVAQSSLDPSTKTGAVLVNPSRGVMITGYNRLPKGVEDKPERYTDRTLKYKIILHCEDVALLRARRDVTGWTMYTWPMLSCSSCAGLLIEAGIVRCVAVVATTALCERWGDEIALARELFDETGVKYELIEEI